jgi:large subunit ribosomal protein L25
MSSQYLKIDLEKRERVKKGLTALRTDGKLPAVIHNHGKESIHVQADYKTLVAVYKEAGKSHPIELSVDGSNYLALIKDVDINPVKKQIRHVVLQAIKQNEKVEAEVAVVLEGDAPAERQSLTILTQLDTVQVQALPRNLVDTLTVNAEKLVEVGDKLTVADIKVPEGITIMNAPEQQIAIVELPRDQAAEADASAESLADDAASDEEPEATEVSTDDSESNDTDQGSSDSEEPSDK